MMQEKVIICGVVKNAGNYLEKSLELCIEISKKFSHSKIVIYENNSEDNTKSILQQYSDNPKFKIISEDISYDYIKKSSQVWAFTKVTGSDHPCRIEQISNARNKVLDEIRKLEYDNYDYVIWIDLDTTIFSTDIERSFDNKEQWDVLYANGMDYNGVYYDMYAYRDKNENALGPEIIGDYYWDNIHKKSFKIPSHSSELIPVVSAFGGLGIYKKQIFNDLSFGYIVSPEIEAYYLNLLSQQTLPHAIKDIIQLPCKKFPGGYTTMYGDASTIYWKNNSGYDNVVICEHAYLNMVLHNMKFRKYIDPKIVYVKM
jgi:hypothetical protein